MSLSFRKLLILVIAIVVGSACGGEDELAAVLVTFETPAGSFIARIDDPASVDRAREAFDGNGLAVIPNGRIVQGDGGVTSGTVGTSRTSNCRLQRSKPATERPISSMKTLMSTWNWAITARGVRLWSTSIRFDPKRRNTVYRRRTRADNQGTGIQ